VTSESNDRGLPRVKRTAPGRRWDEPSTSRSDRNQSDGVGVAEERLVVAPTVEHPANFHVVGRKQRVYDDEAPLEAEDTNAGAKIVAPAAKLRKRLQLLAL
jgi:hypothetical protein